MLDELVFKVYITECLRIISENTGSAIQGGKAISKKYLDIRKAKDEPEETRTSEEIINNMKAKLGKLREQ